MTITPGNLKREEGEDADVNPGDEWMTTTCMIATYISQGQVNVARMKLQIRWFKE